MSDKPESQEESKGVVRKRAPSFDEIMQGVTEPKSSPPPAVRQQPEKKSAQPSFEEILARAQPEAQQSRPPELRRARPPRKEERKMPIVERKPALGGEMNPQGTRSEGNPQGTRSEGNPQGTRLEGNPQGTRLDRVPAV